MDQTSAAPAAPSPAPAHAAGAQPRPPRRVAPPLHGLLAIDKPRGMISKDVSRWLVKRLGKLKIGHVGTLDPAASGVLPVLLGRATRLQDYLLDLPKAYEFDVKLGSETDTLDLDGQVVLELPFDHVTTDAMRAAVQTLVGDIEQIPPVYSAVKYKGRPLYDYARSQNAGDLPLESMKRKVHVASFELLAHEGDFASFRVLCSRGTYVRTLVKDLADKLGSCGTLTRLVRTQAAGVGLDQAVDLDQLEARLGEVASLVVPIEGLSLGLIRWRCPTRGATDRLKGGQQLAATPADYAAGVDDPGAPLPGAWARPVLLLDDTGEAFGIGAVRGHESGRMVISMKRGLS
jgi:tRNA pseudouridine55 synthase